MEPPKLRVFAWNVRGLRSLLTQPDNILAFMQTEKPDIIFFPETHGNKLQETKVQTDLDAVFKRAMPNQNWVYHWTYCHKAGIHGNGVAVRADLPIEWVDTCLSLQEPKRPEDEGRVISVKLAGHKEVFIGLYVPNASLGKPGRLQFKLDWLRQLRILFDSYRARGLTVVALGDINVAPDERDICNPASNLKTAGYLPEERETFAATILPEYVDLWREQHPIPRKTQKQQGQYTFWTMRNGTARANNSGWRLDLVLLDRPTWSECGAKYRAIICPQYQGSDHCPIGVEIC